MRALRWVGGIARALLIVACDGAALPTVPPRLPHVHPPASGEPPPENPVPSEDELLVRAATCEYQARCTPEAMAMYPGGDVQGCLDVPFCYRLSHIGRSSVDDFEACLEELRRGPCSARVNPTLGPIFEAPSPCTPHKPKDFSEQYVGKPELGEPCLGGGFDEFACAEGLWCSLEVPGRQAGNFFCGTCTAELELGATCTDADHCRGGSRCFDGECRAVLENGEACTSSNQCLHWTCTNGHCADPQGAPSQQPNYGDFLGQPCVLHSAECGFDPTLSCIGGVCVPAPDRGEPCDSIDDCRVGLGCHEGGCEDIPCYVELGGFCGWSGICANASSRCDDTGHCVELPREGEPCSDGLFVRCALDWVCDPDTDLCRSRPLPLPVGAPCVADFAGFASGYAQCESGTMCLVDLGPYCDITPQSTSCIFTGCDTECGVCSPIVGVEACQ